MCILLGLTNECSIFNRRYLISVLSNFFAVLLQKFLIDDIKYKIDYIDRLLITQRSVADKLK